MYLLHAHIVVVFCYVRSRLTVSGYVSHQPTTLWPDRSWFQHIKPLSTHSSSILISSFGNRSIVGYVWTQESNIPLLPNDLWRSNPYSPYTILQIACQIRVSPQSANHHQRSITLRSDGARVKRTNSSDNPLWRKESQTVLKMHGKRQLNLLTLFKVQYANV